MTGDDSAMAPLYKYSSISNMKWPSGCGDEKCRWSLTPCKRNWNMNSEIDVLGNSRPSLVSRRWGGYYDLLTSWTQAVERLRHVFTLLPYQSFTGISSTGLLDILKYLKRNRKEMFWCGINFEIVLEKSDDSDHLAFLAAKFIFKLIFLGRHLSKKSGSIINHPVSNN